MAEQNDNREAKPPPAPRGSSPTPPGFPRLGLSRRWIVFFLALLAVNVFVSSRAMAPESRVRVPYSPFFLEQVRTGNVAEITSKGTDIQGTFEKQVAFEESKPTTRFRTEIPAFADTDELSRLLQENEVTVNAKPLDTGGAWWQTLLVRLRPDDPARGSPVLAVPPGGQRAERPRRVRPVARPPLRALRRQGDASRMSRGSRRRRRS